MDVAVGVDVGVAVGVTVCAAVGVAVGVGVRVGVCAGVGAPVGVSVPVGVGTGVPVRVSVGVLVSASVGIRTCVEPPVGVPVRGFRGGVAVGIPVVREGLSISPDGVVPESVEDAVETGVARAAEGWEGVAGVVEYLLSRSDAESPFDPRTGVASGTATTPVTASAVGITTTRTSKNRTAPSPTAAVSSVTGHPSATGRNARGGLPRRTERGRLPLAEPCATPLLHRKKY